MNGSTSQLKPIPPLINKRHSDFIPLVRRPKAALSEFRSLVIGRHFKMTGATDVDPIEKELILEKIAASNMERNAKVVSTVRAKDNPIGQIWTLDPNVKVTEVNWP